MVYTDVLGHIWHLDSFSQAEKDQRLIYSGKLLQDNLLLSDVFSKVRTSPSEEMLSFQGRQQTSFHNRPVNIVYLL